MGDGDEAVWDQQRDEGKRGELPAAKSESVVSAQAS